MNYPWGEEWDDAAYKAHCKAEAAEKKAQRIELLKLCKIITDKTGFEAKPSRIEGRGESHIAITLSGVESSEVPESVRKTLKSLKLSTGYTVYKSLHGVKTVKFELLRKDTDGRNHLW